MKRFAVLTYGTLCYLLFLGVTLYAMGFVGNILVPRTIDTPVEGSLLTAIFVDSLLLLVFALQHSVMARPVFKKWLTRYIPQAMERSTYVLCTNLALILLFWQWRPIGVTIWNIEHPMARMMLHILCVMGWLTVLSTTFLINHFDLFGLRQVWLYFRGQPYRHLPFKTPGPYRFIRHPLYIGWMTAFWATPTMGLAHLLFAILTTAYMLIAIIFEERDLIAVYGKTYTDYRNRVGMLLPRLTMKSKADPVADLKMS